jgi:TctA family transporter
MFSLATFASINKSRVGTTAWLSEFTGIKENAMLLAFLFLVGIIISAAIIYLLRKKVASAVVLNSKPIAYALIAYLAFICFLLDSWLGLAVLALAAALGWLTVRLGVEKVNLMGAVLLPTLMLLFGIVVA